MNKNLLRVVNRIQDRDLRMKVYGLLQKPSIKIGGRTYSGISIEQSPASVWHHHNYPGGFVEHTLSLYELCMGLIRIVKGFTGVESIRTL